MRIAFFVLVLVCLYYAKSTFARESLVSTAGSDHLIVDSLIEDEVAELADDKSNSAFLETESSVDIDVDRSSHAKKEVQPQFLSFLHKLKENQQKNELLIRQHHPNQRSVPMLHPHEQEDHSSIPHEHEYITPHHLEQHDAQAHTVVELPPHLQKLQHAVETQTAQHTDSFTQEHEHEHEHDHRIEVDSKVYAVHRGIPGSLPFGARSADPPCTSYARQDNCVGYPPVRSDALPACGNFDGKTANVTSFLIIGDYGLDANCEALVAELVQKIEKQFGTFQFVMTTGDNAYWNGACQAFQDGVARYYSQYFNSSGTCEDPTRLELLRARSAAAAASHFPYHPHDHRGASPHEVTIDTAPHDLPSRFWPTLGNHDWTTYGSHPLQMPYFQFFPYLMNMEPSNLAHGQFYTVKPHPDIQLFSLNSNIGSPSSSVAETLLYNDQTTWIEQSLKESNASFKFVYFHHPPYCTAQHDPLAPWMDLDYEDWGATMVLSGHEHVYERLLRNKVGKSGNTPTIPYIVNGLGGHPWLYNIENCPVEPGSQFRYNAFHGAQLGLLYWDEVKQTQAIDICFYSMENGGSVVDQFTVLPTPNPTRK